MGLEAYLAVGPPGPPNQIHRIALTCTNTRRTIVTISGHWLVMHDLCFLPLWGSLAMGLSSPLVVQTELGLGRLLFGRPGRDQ